MSIGYNIAVNLCEAGQLRNIFTHV